DERADTELDSVGPVPIASPADNHSDQSSVPEPGSAAVLRPPEDFTSIADINESIAEFFRLRTVDQRLSLSEHAYLRGLLERQRILTDVTNGDQQLNDTNAPEPDTSTEFASTATPNVDLFKDSPP